MSKEVKREAERRHRDLAPPSAVEVARSLLLWTAALSALLAAGDRVVLLAVAYAAIALGLAWMRRWEGAPRLDRGAVRDGGAAGLVVAAGLAAGYAGYPAWLHLIAWIGLGLGLGAPDLAPPRGGSALVWAATIGLAPLWEELLYRERMLVAFRRGWGVVPAVVLSSTAFALPHAYGGSWALLGTFLVGLALAGVALAGRSVWLCVGVHAGLNLGALAWQHGQAWMVPAPEASAVAGWLGLGGALGLLRRGRVRSRRIAPARVEVA